MFERYSILARMAVMAARKEAGRVGADSIDSEHLLIGIVCVHPELAALLGISIDLRQVRSECEQWHTPANPISDSRDLPVAAELARIFDQAQLIAGAQKCPEIRTEHLLLSMSEEPCHAARLLATHGVSKEQLLALMKTVDCAAPQLGTEASMEALTTMFRTEPTDK